MSDDSLQESLFVDPVGMRFRHAREKARLTLETVAQQLKLPVAVLDAIEREDWSRLGAPIFVRSYVGSYAKALGLPADIAEEVVRGKPVPQLSVISISSPSRRVLDRGLMKLAYLVMTLVIIGSIVMLAMYLQAPRRSAEVLPLDPPVNYSEASGSVDSSSRADGNGAASALAAETEANSPVLASMTPQLPLASGAAGSDIVLRFRAASWVDIQGPGGASLERGMLPAGTERRFSRGELGQVTLGDAAAVEVSQDGVQLDLTPYLEAKVARFTVSSSGKIVATASR